MNIDDKYKKYGVSRRKNFQVIDSVGVPHSYTITPRHLEYADSKFIDENSIRHAEKRGAICSVCSELHRKLGTTILTYDEHKKALLVSCKVDPNHDEKNMKELHKYLLKIKPDAEHEKYAGFAFLDNFSKVKDSA